MNKHVKRTLIISGITLGTIVLGGGAFLLYCADYCHADEYALSKLESSDLVEVSHKDGYYSFEPKGGSENGLVFYPGGKVEASAYAPILNGLAEQGISSYLVEMPLNLAFFNMNGAKKVMDDNPKQHYYFAGHSLGGVMGTNYVASHLDEFEGMILMGSYSMNDFSQSPLRCLSIVASNDKVLNWGKYEESKSLLPSSSEEYVIEGGIHSYFGSYGVQSGDGEASIDKLEQHAQIISECVSFINE